MLVKIRKMQIPAKLADQGSNHQANCCLQPYLKKIFFKKSNFFFYRKNFMKSTTYEYSQPVTMSLHSVGTGFLAFMKSSDPSAPQHPTCKNVKFSDFTKKKKFTPFQKAKIRQNTAK